MTTNIRKVLTEEPPRRQKQTYTLLHFNVLHKVPKVRLNLLSPTGWIREEGFFYKAKPIGANPPLPFGRVQDGQYLGQRHHRLYPLRHGSLHPGRALHHPG